MNWERMGLNINKKIFADNMELMSSDELEEMVWELDRKSIMIDLKVNRSWTNVTGNINAIKTKQNKKRFGRKETGVSRRGLNNFVDKLKH